MEIESGASDGYQELSIDELEKELKKAVTNEDYEKAASLGMKFPKETN